MPTTYNGIGTHYYSKRNVETRVNVCQQCGREGTLTSYDTRLWVVIVFIPVFPLERKRIIDQCSHCSRHYAINLHKWQTAGQLEISGADETYRSSPTAENAIALHQKLLAFHQTARADEFEKEIAQKFPSNAKALAYLGASLAHLGKHTDAFSYFRRALDFRPDLPEAKIGMGMEHLRQNRLHDAQNMFDILDKPGAGQLYSLEPLELLGNAFQAAGHHEDALRCFNRILTELPQAAQHPAFRKKIAKSEKAVGRKQSSLPKKNFNWRNFVGANNTDSGPALTKNGLAAFAVIAAIVIGLFVFSNYYISGHRKIHIVNGLNGRISISIDGAAPFALPPHGLHEVTLSEGSHLAKISGAHTEEIPFDVRASYFSRWFSDPAWVLNPGGAAVLLHESVTYSQTPVPPTYSLHFGKPFEFFPAVTHPFKDLPETVKVSSKSETSLKTRVSEFRDPVASAVAFLLEENRQSEALELAELHLKLNPADDALLRLYLGEVYRRHELPRALSLLESGLTRRPVSIEWHRTYQSIAQDLRPETNIVSLYNDFLAKDPTNSALIYLHGRVLESREQSLAEFQRALAANPTNAYAINALGYDAASHADWLAAKNYFSQAVAIDPNNHNFWNLYCVSRFALREFDSMEKDLRAHLAAQGHITSGVLLIQLLASQNKTNQAEEVVNATVAQFAKDSLEARRSLLTPLQRVAAYSAADFNRLEALCANEPAQSYIALVEQNKLLEAEAKLPKDFPSADDVYAPLVFGLAWNFAGNSSKANEWISRGLTMLERGGKDERVLARLLRQTQPPTDAEFCSLSISHREHAIVAALLQFQHPSHNARFAQWVKRFNVEPTYPYHLLNRIAARSLAAK